MDCCIPLIKHYNAPFWGSLKCRYRALDQPSFLSSTCQTSVHQITIYRPNLRPAEGQQNVIDIQKHIENTAFSGRESATPRCHKAMCILGPKNPSALWNQWEMMLPSPCFVQASFPKFPLPPQHCTEISTISQQKSIPSLRYRF